MIIRQNTNLYEWQRHYEEKIKEEKDIFFRKDKNGESMNYGLIDLDSVAEEDKQSILLGPVWHRYIKQAAARSHIENSIIPLTRHFLDQFLPNIDLIKITPLPKYIKNNRYEPIYTILVIIKYLLKILLFHSKRKKILEIFQLILKLSYEIDKYLEYGPEPTEIGKSIKEKLNNDC